MLALAAALSVGIVATESAIAESNGQEIVWTGLGGDDRFFNPSNWSPETIPGEEATAVFNPEGEIRVLVDEGATAGLRILGRAAGDATATVTLDLAGNTFNAQPPHPTAAVFFQPGTQEEGARRLRLLRGELRVLFDVYAGHTLGGAHTMVSPLAIEVGEGAVLTLRNEAFFGYAGQEDYPQQVSLTVKDGGKVSNQRLLVIGNSNFSETLLRIEGAGSEVEGEGAFPRTGIVFGNSKEKSSSKGVIEKGGVIFGQRFFSLATGAGANVHVTVGGSSSDGQPSSVSADNLYVGGGTMNADEPPQPGGTATLRCSDGAVCEFIGARVFGGSAGNAGGVLEIEGGAVKASGGAAFDPGASLRIILTPQSQGAGPALAVRSPAADAKLSISKATFSVGVADGFSPRRGEVFALAAYDSLEGAFEGLPDGATIRCGNTEFRIDYAGGAGGRTITLTTTATTTASSKPKNES